MIGKEFDDLTVMYEAAQDYYYKAKINKMWKGHKWYYCECTCGGFIIVRGYSLINKNTKSCGCRNHKKSITHGLSNTPEWQTWIGMKGRCLNPNHADYPNYGGRGIEICSQWINDLHHFIKDMGYRPHGYTLDRIDVNGNYSPDNCRWATYSCQNNNRRLWSNSTKKLDELLHRKVTKL